MRCSVSPSADGRVRLWIFDFAASSQTALFKVFDEIAAATHVKITVKKSSPELDASPGRVLTWRNTVKRRARLERFEAAAAQAQREAARATIDQLGVLDRQLADPDPDQRRLGFTQISAGVLDQHRPRLLFLACAPGEERDLQRAAAELIPRLSWPPSDPFDRMSGSDRKRRYLRYIFEHGSDVLIRAAIERHMDGEQKALDFHGSIPDLPSWLTDYPLEAVRLDASGFGALPSVLLNLPQLKRLSLWGPTFDLHDVFALDGLRHLRIDGELARLPRAIGQLGQLESLELRDCRLSELPEEIGQLEQLRHLKLGGNCLTRLPASVGDLRNLASLATWGSRLTSLPEGLARATELKELDLSGSLLPAKQAEALLARFRRTGPSDRTRLVQWNLLLAQVDRALHHAEPSDLEQALEAPEEAVRAHAAMAIERRARTARPSLDTAAQTALFMRYQLSRDPDLRAELRAQLMRGGSIGVRGFIVQDLPLDTITGNRQPFDAGLCQELGLDPLIVARGTLGQLLDRFSVNYLLKHGGPDDRRAALKARIYKDVVFVARNLEVVPAEIGAFSQLVSFELKGCPIERLPEELGALRGLRAFKVGRSELRELPRSFATLTNLRRVSLFRVAMDRMPEELFELRSLEELVFSHVGITDLPPGIGRMSGLTKLDLRSNAISALPASFAQLSELAELELSDNALGRFPPVLLEMPRLEQLSLGRCGLAVLPDDIGRMRGLQRLYLRGNPQLHQILRPAELQRRIPGCTLVIDE